MNGLLNIEIPKKLVWFQYFILGKVVMTILLLWDEPMSKVEIEKNIQYKRADNKVVNPEHRPLKY